MASSRSVLIVGGGVIGLCSAYYAALRGHQVTVVERGAPDHDSCSLGNAGMVVPSHFIPLAAPGAVALGLKWMWNPASPFYIQPRLDWDLISWSWKFLCSATRAHVQRSAPLLRDLSLASRTEFVELAREHGNPFSLAQRGLLMFCKTQHGLDEECRTAEAARAIGVPAEVLSPSEASARDPGVRYDIAGAVHYPKDCHLNPREFIAWMTGRLERLGVDLRFNTPATGWSLSGDRVIGVRVPTGELRADDYVVAGGAWSPETARPLGVRIPMQAGKGYSLTLPRPRQLPALCSIFTEARIAVTPMGNTLRFGGTMEIAGLNEEVRPVRVRGIIESVPKYFPEFTPADFDGVPVWRGLRPCSPDGLPYLGRLSHARNCVIATGHAMMGLSLGPVTGRLVAELLSNETPSMDLSLLNPERFG
ncbi:MAG: FAD-dependent oxidoreductase [Verrucomicrobia bacterium]|nr:FAD-dependent oxidoreductase [Verrucomicrobiota bacterium]MBI3870241.1 FAD-dependent oxidoreductase [Verrucomicrobiota bacterium]